MQFNLDELWGIIGLLQWGCSPPRIFQIAIFGAKLPPCVIFGQNTLIFSCKQYACPMSGKEFSPPATKVVTVRLCEEYWVRDFVGVECKSAIFLLLISYAGLPRPHLVPTSMPDFTCCKSCPSSPQWMDWTLLYDNASDPDVIMEDTIPSRRIRASFDLLCLWPSGSYLS